MTRLLTAATVAALLSVSAMPAAAGGNLSVQLPRLTFPTAPDQPTRACTPTLLSSDAACAATAG